MSRFKNVPLHFWLVVLAGPVFLSLLVREGFSQSASAPPIIKLCNPTNEKDFQVTTLFVDKDGYIVKRFIDQNAGDNRFHYYVTGPNKAPIAKQP